MDFIRNNKFILALFLLALLSGFFWSHKVFGTPLSNGSDEWQYNSLAKSLAMNGKFAPFESNASPLLTATEPFYPIFLGGVYRIFGLGGLDAVRAIQVVIFALTVLILYLLARDLAGQKAGYFTGILMLFFYPLAGMAGSLLREIIFTFLLCFAIYTFSRGEKSLKWTFYIFSGLSLGLAIWTNAIIEFLPLVLAGLAFVLRANIFFKQKYWLRILVFLALAFLPTFLWDARGIFDHSAVPTEIKSGFALARRAEMIETIRGDKYFRHLGGLFLGYYFFQKPGFSPQEFLGQENNIKRIDELKAQGEIGPIELGRKFTEESEMIIFSNIPRFFAITLLDFLQFNGPLLPSPKFASAGPMQNLFINNSYPGVPQVFKIIILIGLRLLFWSFFALAICGTVRMFRSAKEAGFKSRHTLLALCLMAAILYFNLVYSVLYGMARYSVPIYPFYIIFFVVGLIVVHDKIYKRIHERR